MAVERTGQFLDDHQSLRALVESMPPPEAQEYDSYGSRALESVFPNRRMVIYTLRDGEPTDIHMIMFGDIEVSRIQGPTATIQDSEGAVKVGTVPTKYRNRDVFFHVPQNFVLKWKGKRTSTDQVQFVPHYAILIKTKSREDHQVEGHTYCVTLNRFWERFPHLKNIRY